MDVCMINNHFKFFNAEETKELLPFTSLIAHLEMTVKEYAQGQIICPSRLVTPLAKKGIMLSMPAVGSRMAIHKLVNVCPNNKNKEIPTIHGLVTVFDPVTGIPLFALDASTVTSRRTAAVSLLGIKKLCLNTPRHILIIGTGTQSIDHVLAIHEVFPMTHISIKGRSSSSSQAFCDKFNYIAPLKPWKDSDDPDVVITVTTSKTPVYTQAAKTGKLIVGVGSFTPDAAEIAKDTVNHSQIIVDDIIGAKQEAGDIMLAGTDWNKVVSLADILMKQYDINQSLPIFYKTVGCGAWDLGACEVAQSILINR